VRSVVARQGADHVAAQRWEDGVEDAVTERQGVEEAGQQGADGDIGGGVQAAREAGNRFVAAIGTTWSSFADAEPLVEEGLTTTGFDLQSSGFELGVSGEVVLMPWLAAGAAYERLANIELDQTFDVDGFRNFTTELRDGRFDPSVVEVYAAPFWQAGPSVRIRGLVGVGFWRTDDSSTIVLLFQGDEPSRETLREEHAGTALVLGAGIDVWPHSRVGARFAYEYLRLEDGDRDEPLHNLSFMALFGF
jgi:opacity protein-like surface antigen